MGQKQSEEWDPERVQVGTRLVIASGFGRYGEHLYTVARITDAQVVTERDVYRISRKTGRIRGANGFGPRHARIATDADIARINTNRQREQLNTTRWQDVPDAIVAQVYALVTGGAA